MSRARMQTSRPRFANRAEGRSASMSRLAGLLAVLALVLAGCGGTTSDIGTGASDLVPGSAAAFIAVDTDPESSQWQTVDALANKFPDKQKGIDALKREMRKDKVDWDKD